MSLLEWTPSAHDFLPVSLHTFEKLPQVVRNGSQPRTPANLSTFRLRDAPKPQPIQLHDSLSCCCHLTLEEMERSPSYPSSRRRLIWRVSVLMRMLGVRTASLRESPDFLRPLSLTVTPAESPTLLHTFFLSPRLPLATPVSLAHPAPRPSPTPSRMSAVPLPFAMSSI